MSDRVVGPLSRYGRRGAFQSPLSRRARGWGEGFSRWATRLQAHAPARDGVRVGAGGAQSLAPRDQALAVVAFRASSAPPSARFAPAAGCAPGWTVVISRHSQVSAPPPAHQ